MKYKYKRRYKRKTNYKKRTSVASVARKLNKLHKAIEYKHHDSEINVQVSNAGYFINLTEVPQGDQDIERDGDKITTTSVQFRLQLYGGDIPYNNCRIVLFKWNNLYQTPGVGDLFLQPTSSSIQPHLWQYNLDRIRARPGFKVLYDKTITNTTANNEVNKKATNLFRKIKFRSNLQYTGGSTYGNSLYMFLISDSAVSNHPLISGTKRVNFMDL